MTSYVLDSDVFMQACNLHYGFPICPGFWDWIDKENAAGRVLSIEKVKEEILVGRGELIEWAKSRRKDFFVSTEDSKTYESLKLLSAWAVAHYSPAACERFFRGADFLLVGFAHAHGYHVVTQEVSSSGAQIKIPNACAAMNVKPFNTFEFLTLEKARFILDQGGAPGET